MWPCQAKWRKRVALSVVVGERLGEQGLSNEVVTGQSLGTRNAATPTSETNVKPRCCVSLWIGLFVYVFLWRLWGSFGVVRADGRAKVAPELMGDSTT